MYQAASEGFKLKEVIEEQSVGYVPGLQAWVIGLVIAVIILILMGVA